MTGLKRRHLDKCICCGKGVAHAGPTFYRLTLGYYLLENQAIQRRHGLEEMMGGGLPGTALAEIMGTDDDLAKNISENRDRTVIVCMNCAIRTPLALIYEQCAPRKKENRGN